MNFKEIEKEIDLRRRSREEIRSRVTDFCRDEFGINDFFKIVDKYFCNNTERFKICLARQVPTPNVEHISLRCSVADWGFEPIFISLTRDSYSQNGEDAYKNSLINSPRMFVGRKGNLVVQSKRLIKDCFLNNTIFSEIELECGDSLPDVHWGWMKEVFAEKTPQKIEIGGFFSEVLFNAKKNLPKHVFAKANKREVRIPYSDKDCNEDLRPPADWYYFFYLLLFLEGQFGLASTIDEDPKIIGWFEKNNQLIENICGVRPLILNTPLKVQVGNFLSKLNEIPRKALGGNGYLDSISKPNQPVADLSFFQLMKHYQKEIIALA